MERALDAKRLRSAATAAVACVVALAGAGCGEDDFANQPRPPSPIVVSATISDGRVSVSPATFGAGPVTLIVTNQTEATQQITLDAQDSVNASNEVEQQTGPINPRDTASVKVDLAQGAYSLSVGSESIEPARVQVGAKRESAQDKLLQP